MACNDLTKVFKCKGPLFEMRSFVPLTFENCSWLKDLLLLKQEKQFSRFSVWYYPD